MIAANLRRIEDHQFTNGVFANDALLLGLVITPRMDMPAPRSKSSGDTVLDALVLAESEGWEC
jgi:hypothetical protein